MVPETPYAKPGPISIAYQVLGDAPLDLVFVPGLTSRPHGKYRTSLTSSRASRRSRG